MFAIPIILTTKHRKDFRLRNQIVHTELLYKLNKALNACVRHGRFKTALTFLSRIKKSCIITGRSRGIVKHGFSRQGIRFFSIHSYWLGFRKYSW